jgi:hypothetical protein
MTFNASQGGANPQSQVLGIENGGTGSMPWSVTDDQSWLSVAPTSGSSGGEIDNVTVSVNAAGLALGTYNGNITISSPGLPSQSTGVTLNVYPPASCDSLPAGSATGTWEIDPDASGPIPTLLVHCDMDFDGGGWTLIMASGGLGTDNMVQQSVAPGQSLLVNGSYLRADIAQALAQMAEQVHVREYTKVSTFSVTSVPGGKPIQNLRNLCALNVNSAINSAGVGPDVVATEWTGPQATTSRLWGVVTSCGGPFPYPTIYWSVNNFSGLNLNPTMSGWVAFQLGVNLQVWVR